MVTNEEIIREWQTTDDTKEAIAERLGMKLTAFNARVWSLRKHGVPLKSRRHHSGRKPADYAALTELARSLNGRP
jgi:biotin operon repressor